MWTNRLSKIASVSALLLSMGSTAHAATLYVNCGGHGGFSSINAALKALQNSESHGPATINVSGACHENIAVQNMDRLTLNALNGASITDASNGANEVIDVSNSHGFTLTGFTITTTCPSSCLNGPGADAISCFFGAECLLINNTISGAGNGAGVGVYALSKVTVQGGTVQNNWAGLFTNDSGEMFALGVTIQNNSNGAYLNHGGNIAFRVGQDGVTPTVISHNAGPGIFTNIGSSVVVKAPADISANGTEGIHLALGSKLFAGGGGPGVVSITGNGAPGVSLNDASIALFAGNAQVTGNTLPDIACNAATAVTSGAIAAAGGAQNTSCAN
jgi:hypothetical protein